MKTELTEAQVAGYNGMVTGYLAPAKVAVVFAPLGPVKGLPWRTKPVLKPLKFDSFCGTFEGFLGKSNPP